MNSKDSIFDNLRKADRDNIQARADRIKELQDILDTSQIWSLIPGLNKDEANYASIKLDALEEYADDLWHQTKWCYINKLFLSCIATSACTLESALKHQLINKTGIDREIGLGTCITRCKNEGILPRNDDDEIVIAAHAVNQARNNIIHANYPRRDPEHVLFAEGDEHEKSDSGINGIQFMEYFKALAKNTLVNTNKVLKHLSDSE